MSLGVLVDLILLDQSALDLAVFVHGHKGGEEQADDLHGSLVIISICRVEVIDLVGQIHGNVCAGVFGVDIAAAGSKAGKNRKNA